MFRRSILILSLLFVICGGAFGGVLFSDDFEYANEAALDAAWVNTTPG